VYNIRRLPHKFQYAIVRDLLRQRGGNLTWDKYDPKSLITGKIIYEMAKEVNKLGGGLRV
jgi:hypothetical protein